MAQSAPGAASIIDVIVEILKAIFSVLCVFVEVTGLVIGGLLAEQPTVQMNSVTTAKASETTATVPPMRSSGEQSIRADQLKVERPKEEEQRPPELRLNIPENQYEPLETAEDNSTEDEKKKA